MLADYEKRDPEQQGAKNDIRLKFLMSPERLKAGYPASIEEYDNEFIRWCLTNNIGPGNNWGDERSPELKKLERKYRNVLMDDWIPKYHTARQPRRMHTIRIIPKEEREQVKEEREPIKEETKKESSTRWANVRWEDGKRMPN